MIGDSKTVASRTVMASLLAGLLEAASIWLLLSGTVQGWAVCHLGASVAAVVRFRAGIYRDGVLCCALFVPVLGPPLAPWLFAAPDRTVANAHAAFETFEAEVLRAEEFAGRHLTERAAPLSIHEVLRHGSTDHRRNALRKLAERGEPRHLALLRRCLSHEDVELRLGAFSEINRLLRSWESRLADARRRANAENVATSHLTVARIHREYAASGLLDGPMTEFHLARAEAACADAGRHEPSSVGIAVERVLVAVERGDLDGARRALRPVPAGERRQPELCLARARAAFAERRFGHVVDEARRLRQCGYPVPSWMQALADDREAESARNGVLT